MRLGTVMTRKMETAVPLQDNISASLSFAKGYTRQVHISYLPMSANIKLTEILVRNSIMDHHNDGIGKKIRKKSNTTLTDA
jgi:hypothetical protein